ncbi:conserved hypothetical protein [Desulfovibrionales bacterium]
MFEFLKHFAKTKAEDAQSGLMRLLVEFDPEGASEAEISQLYAALTKITRQMFDAKKDYDRELKEAEEIRKNYDLRVNAAERLQVRLDATADTAEKAQIEASLNKLVADLEAMTSQAEREQQEAKDAKAYYEELNAAVKIASERLNSSRTHLTNAKRRMDMAKLQAQRANEQEGRAKSLAGITQQTNRLSSALEAMTKRAEELEIDATVSHEKTSLLTSSKDDPDPLIAQALQEAQGKKPILSLQDRLAVLKRK